MTRLDYLKLLTEQIRCKKARPMIEEEYQAHIDDQKLDFMAQGMSEAEAEEAAVREMGDPVEVGVQLDRIHRPKMDMHLATAIIGISALGMVIQIFLERTAILCGAGSYPGEGVEMVGWNCILWTAAGILFMTGICFVDYSLIGKYAFLIWGAVMILIVGYRIFGRTVNGMYSKLGLFYCILVPVFAGIVFRFRGSGRKGMIKCILILILSTVLPLIASSSVYMTLFYITGVGMLALAIQKGWFGKDKKKQFLIMAGTTVLIPAGMIGVMMSAGQVFLRAYQSDRLKMLFRLNPSENFIYQAVLEQLRNAVDAVAGKEGLLIEESTSLMWSEIRSDYVWLFVFKMLGTWQGILFTIAVAGFLGGLFWMARKQKNQLGYMVGMACVLMITLEFLVYVGTNAGILYPTSVYVPFFGFGKSNILITYFYMGILMSIARNQSVVKAG